MPPPVPLIEIPHDADAPGVGRPDGEARAREAFNRAQLRAQFFVDAPLIAFAEQKKVRLAQRREKRIVITRAVSLALSVRDGQFVAIDAVDPIGDALKKARLVNALKLEAGPFAGLSVRTSSLAASG